MRDADDEFLRSIPPFLRRREAQRPEKSLARLPGPAAEERVSEPIKPVITPAALAAQTSLAQDSGAQDSGAQTAAPRLVELAARQAEEVQVETVQAGADPAGQRAHIELAFDNETASDDAGAEAGAEPEDVAFQVTLPRSVVRQIRVLAAKKDTTQRAIVLRALRLPGLWVPEGTDVDRRGRTAKRRQQA